VDQRSGASHSFEAFVTKPGSAQNRQDTAQGDAVTASWPPCTSIPNHTGPATGSNATAHMDRFAVTHGAAGLKSLVRRLLKAAPLLLASARWATPNNSPLTRQTNETTPAARRGGLVRCLPGGSPMQSAHNARNRAVRP
jgi:hypothetical protein